MKKKGVIGLLAAGAALAGVGIYNLVKGKDEDKYCTVPESDDEYDEAVEAEYVEETEED